jgi:hypothetical protein
MASTMASAGKDLGAAGGLGISKSPILGPLERLSAGLSRSDDPGI